MEGRRWAVVDSILGAALERAPHEREAFVHQTCADDEELRRDVESLLAQVRDAGDFLEPPARQLLDVAAASGRDSVPGSFGPYRMLEPLGSGGMGDVYRARDDRLKRDVALKVLPNLLAADPDRLARFQREAEILASLNHPHIAAIYGVEERDGLRALSNWSMATLSLIGLPADRCPFMTRSRSADRWPTHWMPRMNTESSTAI